MIQTSPKKIDNGNLSQLLLSVLTIAILSIIIQDSYALQQQAGKIELNLNPGESKTFKLGLFNDKDVPSTVEIRADGEGSEFLSFSKSVEMPPKVMTYVEFQVSIPMDYQNNILLKPSVYAKEFGEKGGMTVIDIQAKKTVSLIIGNPVIEEKSSQSNIQQTQEPICGPGTVLKDNKCVPIQQGNDQGGLKITGETKEKTSEKTGDKKSSGGCLIATATYDTELAPQVQHLREIRDNLLLTTESGSTFMAGFNEFYYSFSPIIADMERQSPIFKETVKIAITPMISSLSIMSLVDNGSESDVLFFGISVIALNLGMYFVAPTLIALQINKHRKIKN